MKKLILVVVMAGMFTHGSVYAQEEAGKSPIQPLKGPTIGAVAGGILAGPPGIVAGLIGGAVFGHIDDQKEQIQNAGQALKMAQHKIESLSTQQASEHARMLQQVRANQMRLQAVAQGFSFCLGFRTESADIEPAIQPHLNALAGMLNAFQELDIEVYASADRRGTDSYNLELTRLRAQAVVQQLREAGVSSERIRMKIGGEQTAVYPETDTDGLAFDRYVVLSFVAEDAS
ncbi:MAG: OmpA family protein [Gammaproteobacteria bacterium]|nr:OmpA family protein [Gammaproteobacteria bacterium]